MMWITLLTRLKERICLNKVVAMEDIIPLIKEKINEGGKAKFTPKGNSMLPMLRNNLDTVTLAKPVFPLKKYEIPLYIRKNGQYVLHRVVGMQGDTYVMRGDNQFYNECGIEDEQIIGVVTSFTRKGKDYSCNSLSYRIYCKLWVESARFRIYYRRVRRFAGKVKRKILG